MAISPQIRQLYRINRKAAITIIFIIWFIIERTCVCSVHTQNNYALCEQQRSGIPKSKQCNFNSCSFNYKSDYSLIFYSYCKAIAALFLIPYCHFICRRCQIVSIFGTSSSWQTSMPQIALSLIARCLIQHCPLFYACILEKIVCVISLGIILICQGFIDNRNLQSVW